LSDKDILVEFTPEKHTFDNFMEVVFLLEEILGRKVEMITPEALSPHIGPYILKAVTENKRAGAKGCRYERHPCAYR
jgi:predicted nucleotidyltransferase